jgi:hypothetical protein
MFNGTSKVFEIKTILPKDEKLKRENYFLRELSEKITSRIKEIWFSHDNLEFKGNLEFNDEEYLSHEKKQSPLDELLSEITPEEQEKTDVKMQLAAKISDTMAAIGWNNKMLMKALGKKTLLRLPVG